MICFKGNEIFSDGYCMKRTTRVTLESRECKRTFACTISKAAALLFFPLIVWREGKSSEKSREKSNRLTIHALLCSILRSNVERKIERKIESFGQGLIIVQTLANEKTEFLSELHFIGNGLSNACIYYNIFLYHVIFKIALKKVYR